jgi:gliding motility-associated-like protein
MNFCKLYIVLILSLFCTTAFASHISGGELFYQYLGPGTASNSDHYRVSVRLFRECTSTGQILNTEYPDITIYVTGTNQYVTDLPLTMTWVGDPVVLQNTPGAIPCLTGDGALCYQIGVFDSVIDLPRIPNGYTLTWVRCCRQQVTNVQNTPYPDSARGATFLTHIPGTNILPVGHNSSPEFVVKDTALVCAGNPFKLYFSAIDPDNDSLVYSFCDAYLGATPDNPNPFPNLNPPPFVSYPPSVDTTFSLIPLPYLSPYSGSSPLGSRVSINTQTGIISGIAPDTTGKYVVNVCVSEYRHGILLNVHHKDFILTISDCSFASALLNPSYLTCNGYGLQFENQSSSAGIYSYYWNFGVPGSTSDTSSQAQPFYNFPDSGTYSVQLVVNRGSSCGDSTTTLAKIYPGFKANFGFAVQCLPAATLFVDSSTTKYGKVTGWVWNFGDTSGTSNSQNPSYVYQTPGSKTIMLTVTNTKGCTDSITRLIYVPGPPLLSLYYTDTSICNRDSVQLLASASPTSTFSWSPAVNIINPSSPTPIVYPSSQTKYTVAATDTSGCSSNESVTVTVNPLPTVTTIPDTAICNGTSVTLATYGNGTSWQWQPSTGLSSTTVTSPVATPQSSIQYIVFAQNALGCAASDTVNVRVKASPTVMASPDSLICVGGSAHLEALAPATATFSWTPTTGLSNPLVSNPVASPIQSTTYKVQATDSNACTGIDTVVITVIPKPVFAVTPSYKQICTGDSLQFTASGGAAYQWLPATNIVNDTAAAAVVFPPATTTYSVIITSTTCRIYDTLQAVADISQPFPLTVSKSNDIDCFTSQAALHATGGDEYTWSPAATLNNPYSANPVATPVETTTYYVTAGNGTACFEKDSIQVKIVTTDTENGYGMPSAFTPNGDGYNDCFGVKDWGGIKSIQFLVYNRWGQKVFATYSPSGCWDGTLNGVPQAPGTYVYQIWANTACGNVYRKGTVVLVR